MSVPLPPTPLNRHCSIVHNGTLYTASADGFYSLPLKKGANWAKLAKSVVHTEGPVCVRAHKGMPNEALYLVGGNVKMASNTVPDDYAGVQRWTFSTRQWEILP